VTLVTYRCVPEGGRSRPRPATVDELLGCRPATSTGFVQAGLDAWWQTGIRPRWLSAEFLRLLEQQGRVVGVVYLLHFDRPIGDLANPRGYAGHYTGWTENLPARLALHTEGRGARLVDHAAGRGARLMEVVGEKGIGWQLARVWTGTRTRERSLKQSGGAARRCPVCQLATLGLQPPRPVDPLALELGPRVAAFATAPPLIQPPAVAA
jgi:predicted GIY-YIG superfamily endonuclease